MLLKKGKAKVTFVYQPIGPSCKRVQLVGEFNNWQPEKGRMTRQKDGSFRKQVNLDPGEYRYKFFVDGNWVEDPQADGLVPNEFGTFDSLVSVG
ncbi:MAG: isoamylase early set domain-containing protein [Planctomycetota bacterium]|nr:MAG: isoamylase early set domain-containing protein [Planctomycetota bacterium]